MPYKSERIKIEYTKHDKRIKLTDEQRRKIKEDWQSGLISQRSLAKKYNVSRRTIFNILYPEKYTEQLEKYKENKHSEKYYDKEKNKEYIKTHRRYKQNLYLKGEIKDDK